MGKLVKIDYCKLGGILNDVIKEFLEYYIIHVEKDGKVKYPDGTIIQYFGLPAITDDLREKIIDTLKDKDIYE